MAYDDEKHFRDKRRWEEHERTKAWFAAQPVEDVAGEGDDALAYVKAYYRVPAEVGGRVLFVEPNCQATGKKGTITGGTGPYVLVRFDGEEHELPCHPRGLDYLGPAIDPTPPQPLGEGAKQSAVPPAATQEGEG